jgi:DNA-binding transcriptional MerR regulator
MFGPIEIPNKSSFKINEVCALTGVKSYVLRFWESEFTEISPIGSSTGQKLYEHRDIESILLIKKLLFEDKMTIEKAKAEMKILMPKELFIDKNFSENYSYNKNEDQEVNIVDSKLEEFSVNNTANNTANNTVREAMTKRVLVESDIKKLMMAKNKLTQILELTDGLHSKNQWS